MKSRISLLLLLSLATTVMGAESVRPANAPQPSTELVHYNNVPGYFKINTLRVLKFPKLMADGRGWDKNGNLPDLYVRLYENGKYLGRSVWLRDPQHSAPSLAGAHMPFRLKPGVSYRLQLADFDNDGSRLTKSNKDEVLQTFNFTSDWVEKNVKWIGKKGMGVLLLEAADKKTQLMISIERISPKEALSQKVYIKGVKPLLQEEYRPGVLEGCGPVAAAMLLTYYDKLGYQTLDERDAYNGRNRPTQTIRSLYKLTKTRKSPGKTDQSFTRKVNLRDGLRHYARIANQNKGSHLPQLMTDMNWSGKKFWPWSKTKAELRKYLLRENPVIALMGRTPSCLGETGGDKVPILADHYVVIVGFDDSKQEYYIMNGWGNQDADKAKGPESHDGSIDGLCTCSYSDVAKADPSLIFIKR